MLEEIKNYLAITWDDSVTNSNIQNIIEEGMDYLERIVGSPIDFNIDKTARVLLKDYCRYVRNYSLEYFETNFQSAIIRLQLEYASKSSTSSI